MKKSIYILINLFIYLCSCSNYRKVGMVVKTQGNDTIKGKYAVYHVNRYNKVGILYTDSCFKKFSLIKKRDLN